MSTCCIPRKTMGFYIGFSTNLKRRLREHTRGASFATISRGPWKLIYYEAYTEREDAEGREKFLKSGSGRRFLRAQLRHYLRVKGFASRGVNQRCTATDILQPREVKPFIPLGSHHVSEAFYAVVISYRRHLRTLPSLLRLRRFTKGKDRPYGASSACCKPCVQLIESDRVSGHGMSASRPIT